MTDRFLRLFVLIIAFSAHLVAYFQFRNQELATFISNQQKFYFLTWLVLSLLLVLILPIIRNRRALFLLITVRGLFLALIGRIVGNFFGVELTLLIGLIIEIIGYNRFWDGLGLAVGIIVVTTFFQTPKTIFGVAQAIPFFESRLAFCFYAAIIAIMAALLRFQRENQVSATELNRRLEEATVELASANMKLQEFAITAEHEAMLNERKRIAREIHDTLAYTLTNLVMMMEAAIDLAAKGSTGLRKHLEIAREQAKEGLTEVRYALQALRPVQFSNVNGLVAVHRLVKAFEKATQIKVNLELADAPLYFGEEAGQTVFRLVQEGMTNALRHGRASEITLLFTKYKHGLFIQINDNGKGIEGEGPQIGYGLVGMRERIEQLGGNLQVFSAPGRGFTLEAWIPLTEE